LRTGDGRTRIAYTELDHPGLAHGIVVFKEPTFGVDYSEWVSRASAELGACLRPAPKRTAIPHQIHSNRVIDVDAPSGGGLEGDGVVTAEPLTAIGISVSDCVPLFAVDLEAGVVGLAHCGWRGLAGGIVEELLRVFLSKGADPVRASFLIGAAVGPCCYEVGEDLLACFTADEVRRFSKRTDRGTLFDLKAVTASRLVSGGARPGKISIDKTCTSCKKYLLSSFRADGRGCGRMLAFLMLTG
jgi:YfiH family protein